MRILLISQMYPGPEDPDLGAFVAQLETALEARGHELERAVLDTRAGGKRRYLSLARRARASSRRFQPDVVYAHFLVPAGLIASFTSRAPLVVTAHGRDVRNVGAVPGIRALTRLTVRRASAVIAVSDYLRRELEVAELPAGAPVEYGAVDLVPSRSERALELYDERAEVGVVGPRVHLRDQQDPHGLPSLTKRPRACDDFSQARGRCICHYDRYAGSLCGACWRTRCTIDRICATTRMRRGESSGCAWARL